MATTNGTGEPLEPLTYKTWVLKVSIHCQGCKRKVNKVLHDVEGVYAINIDMRQQKVVVTGNVEAETLIRKLIKSGRHAELWPEPPPDPKEKKPKKSKKKDKENEGDTTSEEEEEDGDEDQNDQNTLDVEKHPIKVEIIPEPSEKIPGCLIVEKKEGVNPGSVEKPTSGGKRKKKKKKGHKTVALADSPGGGEQTSTIPTPQDNYPGPPQINLGPPSHHGYHQFPSYYHLPTAMPSPTLVPTPVYTMSYNTTYSNTGFTTPYYAVPTPSSYPTYISDTVPYSGSPPRYSYGHVHYGPEVELPPSDSEYYPRRRSYSLELFSEENPNGCLIM